MRVAGDGWELQIEHNTYTYRAMEEPDPDWEQEDAQGHVHTYDSRGETWETNKVDEYWCHDCGDWHWKTETTCILCGDMVSPGTRPGRERHITGPADVTGSVWRGHPMFGRLIEAYEGGDAVEEVAFEVDGGKVVASQVYPTGAMRQIDGAVKVTFQATGLEYRDD